MVQGIPPGSELAKEIQLADEAKQFESARLRSDLIAMTTTETPQTPTRAPRKPAPTLESKPPTEAKKTPNKNTDNLGPSKKDARAPLNKKMEVAWSDEAVSVFADASDNFVRHLLKLRTLSWDRVLDQVTQAREERCMLTREAGKHAPAWLPADIEQAAKELDNPIASIKRTPAKTPASPSLPPSPSVKRTASPFTEAESNRFKKRKTNEDQATPTTPAPMAQMEVEAERSGSSAWLQSDEAEAAKDGCKASVNVEKPKKSKGTGTVGSKNADNEVAGTRADKRIDGDNNENQSIMDRSGPFEKSDLGGTRSDVNEFAKDEQKNELKTSDTAVSEDKAPSKTSSQDDSAPKHPSKTSFDKLLVCLERIAEASTMGWKVRAPQRSQLPVDQMPLCAPLFVPLVIPTGRTQLPMGETRLPDVLSTETDWALLIVQADRRWAMVHTSSARSHARVQLMAKNLLSDISELPSKMLFPAPIYQEDDDAESGLALFVTACYRATGHEVPLVVEDLKGWRIMMDLLAGEWAGDDTGKSDKTMTKTIEDLSHSSIKERIAAICKLAGSVRESVKLEHHLSTLIANSDLPTGMPVISCAQVFAKLALECTEASVEVQDCVKHISAVLNKSGNTLDGQARVPSDYERLGPVMHGLLQSLRDEC